MATLWQDLAFGARMLWKEPGFTLVAVATLALGIGANTAIFTVVNSVLLRPLPYKDPGRVVAVKKPERKGIPGITGLEYLEWRGGASFEHLAAHSYDNFNLTGEGEPERLPAAQVTANLFPLLGVAPLAGRTFLPEEDAPGRNHVVVVSQGFWQRRYGGDPSLVGRSLTLNEKSYTVVGIMPESFRFPGGHDIWMPLALNPATEREGKMMTLVEVVGRLKPGVGVEAARAELEVVGRRIAEGGEEGAATSLEIVPLHQQLVSGLRATLLILFGTVALVLLVACANVANLQLARSASRRKEMAIRAAVGASRWRIARQLLTESVVLASAGGLCGALLAMWCVGPVVSLIPESVAGSIQGAREAGADARVFLFTFSVSCLTALVFGLAPALQASRPDLNESLKEGGAGQTARGRTGRLRGAFVVFELALTLVLLVGAGLLVRSFDRMMRVEPGFDPEGVLTVRIDLPRSRYREAAQARAFYEQLLERVGALPGVASVGLVNHRPLEGHGMVAFFEMEGAGALDRGRDRPVPVGVVNPDYFRTLGIPLSEGRAFGGGDTRDGAQVAVVNESFARRFYPNESPVGRRISFGCEARQLCRTIVGVAGDVRQEGLTAEPAPEIFVPHTQGLVGGMTLMVRTAGADPLALAGAVRAQVSAVDKDQPVSKVKTLSQHLADATARSRSLALLLVLLASVALVLAVVGVYGVVSYTVARRTHEFGIRMALGARGGDVLRLVAGQGAKLVLLGVAAGLAGAAALTRLITSLLYGVSATDPLTFAGVAALLAGVALLACLVPARRAARVDPMTALRYE